MISNRDLRVAVGSAPSSVANHKPDSSAEVSVESQAVFQKAAAMLLNGARPKDIVSTLHVSGSEVATLRAFLGIPKFGRGRKIGDGLGVSSKIERNTYVLELHEKGVLSIRIAETLGLSRQRVNQILYPDKRRARNYTTRLALAGKLIKSNLCQICGLDGKLVKHHFHYQKNPIGVIWVCNGCHSIADAFRQQRESDEQNFVSGPKTNRAAPAGNDPALQRQITKRADNNGG